MASQRSTACARRLVARSACLRTTSASDFFPNRPNNAITKPLFQERRRRAKARYQHDSRSANQDRAQQHLVGLALYLEADEAATVLLGERRGAPHQPLVEAILWDVRDVLPCRLLGRHVLAVDARAVLRLVLRREPSRKLGVVDRIVRVGRRL